MIKKVLIASLVIFALTIYSVVTFAGNKNVVASLDDENVTLETLAAYVDDVAGRNYKSWLNDSDGLRKLADFYINRTLLLSYARKTVDKNDTIVTNHNARSVDEDVMYLTTLLKLEVQDKVVVTEEEVASYMEKKNVATEKQASQELESELKNQLMTALVEKVRAGHEIRYYD